MNAVNVDAILRIAKTTPYQEECALAARVLMDPTLWEQVATTAPIPPSHLSALDAKTLEERYITSEFDGEVKAWGMVGPRDEESKQRRRTISDMLWSNAFLPDIMRVTFSTMQQLRHLVLRNTTFMTFDFTGWYFQLPVGIGVQPYLCFKVGKKIYTHLRGPMGHKVDGFCGSYLHEGIIIRPHRGM
jgi:hypothetical protein